MEIRPNPTDDEAAAIAAALTTLLAGSGTETTRPPERWRFSGRWWSQPIPMRRNRPW